MWNLMEIYFVIFLLSYTCVKLSHTKQVQRIDRFYYNTIGSILLLLEVLTFELGGKDHH